MKFRCSIVVLALFFILNTHDSPGQDSGAKPPTSGSGITAEQVSKANNPLADLNGLNFHHYYAPSLFGVPDSVANTTLLYLSLYQVNTRGG
jgi:hypothetical protein